MRHPSNLSFSAVRGISLVVVALFLFSCGAIRKTPPPAPTSSGSGAAVSGMKQLLMQNTWGAASLMGQVLDVENPSAELPSLRFLPGGQLAGSTGCNSFQGTYAMVDDRLVMNPGAMTKKFCEGDQEQKFLDAIRKTNTIRLSGQRIELLDAEEAVLMQLKPKR